MSRMGRANLVVLAGAVGMLGWGTVLPYQYAYAASSRGWGTIAAAAASSLFSVGALLAAPLGGRLADRFSPVRVAVVAKIVAATATAAMLVASTPAAFLAAMLVFGAGITAAQPAQAVLILRWVGSRDRRKVFAWQFTASSVGMAVGALLAAQVVDLKTPAGMAPAFLVATAGFGASALLVALAGRGAHREAEPVDQVDPVDPVPADPAAVMPGSVVATVRTLWAVPGIRWVAVVTTLVTLGFYAQFESGLPAYALLFLDVPERTIGIAAAVKLSRHRGPADGRRAVHARRNAASLLVVVGLVWVGCWSVMAVASATSPGVAAVLFVMTYGIFAVGETLFAPVLSPLTASLAPAGMVGTTLGLVTSLQTGVSALGPLLAGVALAAGHGMVFVLVHLVISAAAVLAALRLRRHCATRPSNWSGTRWGSRSIVLGHRPAYAPTRSGHSRGMPGPGSRRRGEGAAVASMHVTRRRALALGLGAAGAAGLAACTTGAGADQGHGSMGPTTTGASPTVPPPPVPPPGPELADPPSLTSVGGRLSTVLQARTATVDLRVGHPVRTYTYDGALPGRTWDVRPGDVLEVQLQNALPPLEGHGAEVHTDRPHQWTTTNLHTHGLHVSPAGASDNVFVRVAPGEQHAYRIEIPRDHSAGFYWYHPHQHGAVCQQLRAGMAGAIIVRGDLDEVAEITAARERVMVVQAVELGSDYALMDPIPVPTKAQAFYPRTQIFWTVNGTMNPTITMYPGEVQRWRIVNAAEGKVAALTLAGHELHAIAWDGLTLGAPETDAAVELSPANRVEVLVKAGAPGRYALTLQPGSSQHPNLHAEPSPLDITDTSELAPRTLATVVVTGTGPAMSLPTTLPAYDPPILPVTRSRTVRYTVDRDPHGEFIAFGIDNQTFDPARTPYRITLGTAEEWTVVNDSDSGHLHSFHIHVNPFKVVAIDGKPLATPLWRDTWLLPVAKGGSFTFRSNFVDFTGTFVEHCHILSHEDLGMMEALEVVDP